MMNKVFLTTCILYSLCSRINAEDFGHQGLLTDFQNAVQADPGRVRRALAQAAVKQNLDPVLGQTLVKEALEGNNGDNCRTCQVRYR